MTMRRQDREVTDSDRIEFILQHADVCRVAFSLKAQPYLVPLSFGYDRGYLYFHGAPVGRKLEMIAANPRVCFEVEYGVKLVKAETACSYTVHFASVIGFGRASLVTDPERKAYCLDTIVRHYSAQPAAYTPEALAKIGVFQIEIDEMTCKQSGQVL